MSEEKKEEKKPTPEEIQEANAKVINQIRQASCTHTWVTIETKKEGELEKVTKILCPNCEALKTIQ
jgi:hypothetical protein